LRGTEEYRELRKGHGREVEGEGRVVREGKRSKGEGRD